MSNVYEGLAVTASPEPVPSNPPPPPPSSGLLSKTGSAEQVNLFHMKLFYHFQTKTIPTLCMGREVWEQALEQSFRFEALMHAILCISARHLSFLFPEEPRYSAAATTHLSKTLSLHRFDLSTDFSAANVDALMTTAILLHYEMWTNADFISLGMDGDTSLDLTKDFIFKLSAGLKQVFANSIRFVFDKPSVFAKQIRYSPRSVLFGAAKISRQTLARFHEFFDYDRPLCLEMLNVPLPYVRGTDLAGEECWIFCAAELSEGREADLGGLQAPRQPALPDTFVPPRGPGAARRRARRGSAGRPLAIHLHLPRHMPLPDGSHDPGRRHTRQAAAVPLLSCRSDTSRLGPLLSGRRSGRMYRRWLSRRSFTGSWGWLRDADRRKTTAAGGRAIEPRKPPPICPWMGSAPTADIRASFDTTLLSQ